MTEFFLKWKIKKYERHLAEHVDDPVYFQKLADLYFQRSQQEHAIKYYHQAIDAYYQEDSRLGKNTEFILGLCWKLIKLEPLDLVAHHTLGQEYCSLREFEKAVTLYRSFAKKLMKAGRYDDVILQYRNILVLLPDDIDTRQNCFSLYWKLGRKREAVDELKTIGEIAERQGNIAKAVECYQRAVKIMPSSSELQKEFRRLVHVYKQRKGESPLRLVVNK